MAQIKKYQNASGPLPGKFTMNGKSLSGQTALDRLWNVYKDTDVSEREMYNMAQRAISDGLEARYNPGDNTIQILDNNGVDVTAKYTADGLKASPSDSRFKRNWGATFDTRNHKFKVGGQRMGMVDMTVPEEVNTTVKTALRRGSGWFDKTSTGAYDNESLLNQDRWDIINDAVNYATDTRKVDDVYSYDGWKDADRNLLRNLGNQFTSYESGAVGWIAGLKDRVQKGTLTSADEAFLKMLGFEKPASTSASATVTTPTGTSDGKKKSNSPSYSSDWAGDTNAASNIGINGINKDAEGNWHINGDTYNNSVWYLGGLDAFKNTPYSSGVAINGRLYSSEEALTNPALTPYLSKFITNGKAAGTYTDWYNAANASGVRFMGDRQWVKDYYGIDDYAGDFVNYDYSSSYNPDFYKYFSSGQIKNAGVQDISSQFADLNGQKVLAYVDPADRDRYGIMIPHYVVRSTNGTYAPYDSVEDLTNAGFTYNQDLYSEPDTFTQNPWNDRGLAVYGTFTTSDGNQENSVVVDRNGAYYIYRGENIRPIKVSPDKVQILQEVLSGKRDLSNAGIEDLGKLGTPSDTQVIFRRQYGGSINRGKASTVTSIKTEDAKHDITTAHKMNGTNGGLTSAEMWQIGGAVADLAGMGVSFIPTPYTAIGGAVIGAGGSTARFVGDIKQDGFQGRDLGAYLTNLGLDAVGIVAPQVAKTAKGAKALRTLKGFAEPIMMGLGALGATKAATVFGKIIKDEDLTSDDWKQLLTGLSMLAGGTAAGVQAGKEAKVLSETSSQTADAAKNAVHNIKVGEKKIKVSNKELSEITGKKNSKQALENLLNKKTDTTISDEQLNTAIKDLGLTTAGRKQSKVKFTEELPEAGTWFHYFANPRARYKGLNTLATKTTAAEIQAANTAIKTKNYTEMPRYKAHTITSLGTIRADLMPNVYSRGFTNYPTEQIKQWTLGGSRSIRDPGFKQGGLLPKFQVGGSIGKALKLPIASLMDLSSALIQNKEISRSYKDLHKAVDAQKNISIQVPKLQSVGIDTSPITQKYESAREPYRNIKTINSDADLNVATNLGVAQQLSALNKQEGTELSSAISQNRITQQNFLNQQAQLETEAANKRSQYYAGLEATDHQLDAEERQNKWANIWNVYSQSVRQRYRNAADTLTNLNKAADLQEAQLDFENKINHLQDQYRQSGSQLSFSEWLQQNGFMDEYRKQLEDYKKASINIGKKYVDYWAKGGKTRSVNETLVIQGDASAKKAVQKMNVDLTKMLLKLMK